MRLHHNTNSQRQHTWLTSKVSVPQAQADRTFDCHDQIPADMTIAQLGRGSQKLVINLAGGPGSCAFDLDHIGADGVRTRLSTHPGGYLMASLNRLNDNSLVACATRIESEATGDGVVHEILTTDIECAIATAGEWTAMTPIKVGDSQRAYWLDSISQKIDTTDEFIVRYMGDSTFSFVNLFNEGRPASDGRYQTVVHLGSHELHVGMTTKSGQYANVPKPDGVLKSWTPSDDEIAQLVSAGLFDEDDFSDGPCPLPQGCPIDNEEGSDNSSEDSGFASMPTAGSGRASGTSGGSVGDAVSICEGALECIDNGIAGEVETGVEVQSPELSASCRLWDGDLKGQFDFSLTGSLEVNGCPTCSGTATLAAKASAKGSLCGQADFTAELKGLLQKKRQHCIGCADQNHKMCLPEFCDEDIASGSGHVEVSQFMGFKPKSVKAGPVSATFKCGATVSGTLAGDGTARDYRLEGCKDCYQCESLDATANATVAASVKCALDLKVKRLGSVQVGCSDCGGLSMSIDYEVDRANGPDCDTKNCQKATASAEAYAQTECVSVGYGWFSIGVQCRIDGEASVGVDTCGAPENKATWSASCSRC